MNSRHVIKVMIAFYVFLFFLYLFGPLMVMSVTAFNTPNYPQAWPFEAFTLDWFVKLWNHRAMMEGLWNSIIIGLGVVARGGGKSRDVVRGFQAVGDDAVLGCGAHGRRLLPLFVGLSMTKTSPA